MMPTPRQQAVRDAAARFRTMQPGAEVAILLPLGQPARRDHYRQIAGEAHRLWGVGAYAVRSVPDGMLVTRLEMADA